MIGKKSRVSPVLFVNAPRKESNIAQNPGIMINISYNVAFLNDNQAVFPTQNSLKPEHLKAELNSQNQLSGSVFWIPRNTILGKTSHMAISNLPTFWVIMVIKGGNTYESLLRSGSQAYVLYTLSPTMSNGKS